MWNCRLHRPKEVGLYGNLEGLAQSGYRGYDSAGIAVVSLAGQLEIRRASGKLRNLMKVIRKSPIDGTCRVRHRWVRTTVLKRTPASRLRRRIVVVHNSIVKIIWN